MAAADDVPLLVRVLAGNPVTSACVLSCLVAVDTYGLRQLHVAVAGAVAGVPWADTATPVVDAVRWRAALPGAVGARLAEGLRFSDAVMAALAGVTRLNLQDCGNVTDELLRRLPTSLRTLNVRGCGSLTARASFAHLSALESLDCSGTSVAAVSLPVSLQAYVGRLSVGVSLAHLSRLRVLRIQSANLGDGMLASLPPGLVELDVSDIFNLMAAASFAHLRALQTLRAAESSLGDTALMSLPPSLVYLDVRACDKLTPTAVLPPLPALRTLTVSRTKVGDTLVASLPAGWRSCVWCGAAA